jgi:hypothetical protein
MAKLDQRSRSLRFIRKGDCHGHHHIIGRDRLIASYAGWAAGMPRPEMYDEDVRSFGKPDVSPADRFSVVTYPVELTINVAFKWQLNSFV